VAVLFGVSLSVVAGVLIVSRLAGSALTAEREGSGIGTIGSACIDKNDHSLPGGSCFAPFNLDPPFPDRGGRSTGAVVPASQLDGIFVSRSR
jgi:hypothetical protein